MHAFVRAVLIFRLMIFPTIIDMEITINTLDIITFNYQSLLKF